MSGSPHLTEADALGYVQDSLTVEHRETLERHLEDCARCAERLDRLLDSNVPPVAPGTRVAISRGASTLIEAELARLHGELSDFASNDPELRALAELSERASTEQLLALLGQTRSPTELSLRSGLASGVLERLFEVLSRRALTTKPLLERAEKAAKALIGPAFERWKESAGMVTAAGGDAKVRRVAASGAIRFEYPHPTEPQYSLLVEETRRGADWFTIITCLGPSAQRRWGFRLRFDPDDEAKSLAGLGLPPELLGVIRVTHGRDPEHWTALLDLLLPCRYGSDRTGEDPSFAIPLQQRGVNGRLPGQPVKVHFWLLD